jgi:SAM-dependent methyltransferase
VSETKTSSVLNLGSGKVPKPGAVNVDISPSVGADIVHDLSKFPWPLPSAQFDEVWMTDVIEHLPDTIATMEELHRVCRDGAVIHIATPHFSSSNSFTDPTHKQHLGMFSFDYFTGDSTHDHYTDVRFRYARKLLMFLPGVKNTVLRRVANRWPAFYERNLCWILPAWFMSIDLVVVKG